MTSNSKVKINYDEIKSKEDVNFQKPIVCGYFSLDQDRKYVPNSQNLMYFFPRSNERLNLNLNEGIRIANRRPLDLEEKLDSLLKFILLNKQILVLKHSDRLLKFDFICYRGLLTKIMSSYYLQESFAVYVTKWKESFYLCETDKNRFYNISLDETQKFTSWGYKFEQYMLTDHKRKPPDTSKPVQECEEFNCVFQSKLNSHSILYGAEMDGILNYEEVDRLNPDFNKIEFMELKTSREVYNERADRILLKFKFIKWWLQCYLVGIKTLFCGFRDKIGYIHKVTRYNVTELPFLARSYWDWKFCLNFGDTFLKIIKETVPENTNDPYKVWKFKWDPSDNSVTYDIFEGSSIHTFLPDWYINGMKDDKKKF